MNPSVGSTSPTYLSPADSLLEHYSRSTVQIGSVTSIDSRELNRTISSNALQALQGRVPGLLVRINSGDPDGAATVQIHGPGRLGDTNPLVVVDGMVIGPSDNLNWLSPDDIETIDVLKDAASAAIYGMRAGNGVLLITTKTGRNGKPRITAETYLGIQDLTSRPELLDSRQYIDYINNARGNGGLLPAYKLTDSRSLDTLLRTNTDWIGALFRQAPVRNTYLSISGGNEMTRYLLSGNHYKQQGIMLGTEFERLSFRVNTDFQLSDNINIGERITINRIVRQANDGTNGQSPIEHAIKSAPYLSITNLSNLGGYNGPEYLDANNDALNSVGHASLVDDHRSSLGVTGDLFGEWKIVEGLSYRASFGFDLRNFDRVISIPAYEMGAYDVRATPSLERSKQTTYNTLLEHQLRYMRVVDEHAFSLIVSGSRQTVRMDDITASTDGLPGNYIRSLTAGQASPNRSVGGTYGLYRLISFLGQTSYAYKEKYVLKAGFRRDGSSRLGSGNRFGLFPFISISWDLGKEQFLQRFSFLNSLKLRVGWGKVGNDNVGDFRYAPIIAQNYNYPFGITNSTLGLGAYPSTLPNKGIRWEASTILNAGLDIQLVDDIVAFSVDYFAKRTNNLLIESPLPASVGATAALINAGSIDNRGVDLSLRAKLKTDWLTFSLSGFSSWQQNRVHSLGERIDPIRDGFVQNEAVTAMAVGQPIGSFFGFQKAGIYQSRDEVTRHPGLPGTEPGDVRYVDQDKEGRISDEDKTFLGSPIPTFYYGLSVSVSGRGFDLTALVQGVSGNQLYNTSAYWLNGYHGRYNAGLQVLGRWTPENPSTTQPRANAADNINFRPSNRFIESGHYLRLKTLQLGYTLPENLTSSWGLNGLRVYVGAQNLFTITRYTGFDPDFATNRASAEGIDYTFQPQPRIFLGGLQLTF